MEAPDFSVAGLSCCRASAALEQGGAKVPLVGLALQLAGGLESVRSFIEMLPQLCPSSAPWPSLPLLSSSPWKQLLVTGGLREHGWPERPWEGSRQPDPGKESLAEAGSAWVVVERPGLGPP